MYKIIMVYIKCWNLSVRMNLMVLVDIWLVVENFRERYGKVKPSLMSWYIQNSVRMCFIEIWTLYVKHMEMSAFTLVFQFCQNEFSPKEKRTKCVFFFNTFAQHWTGCIWTCCLLRKTKKTLVRVLKKHDILKYYKPVPEIVFELFPIKNEMV